MPSKKVLDIKQKKVEELSKKFENATMIMLVEYRGINVEDDTKLRAALRENGNECMVVKNSTIEFAAKNAKVEGIENLEGPTAVIIANENYIEAAKAVYDYAKDHDFYRIKLGILEGRKVEESEIKKIANLPSKETLYTMLASALLGNIRNLAVVLNQVKEKQEENA